MLESKRCDVIERTKQMELLSKNIEEQRIRVEAMEVREVLIKIGRMIQHQTRVGILNRHDGNPG